MRLQSINQSMPNNSRTNFCGGEPRDFIRLLAKSAKTASLTLEARNQRQLEKMHECAGAMQAYIGEIMEFPNAFKAFLANARQHLNQKISTKLSGYVTLPELITKIFTGKSPQEKEAALNYLRQAFWNGVREERERMPDFDAGNYDEFISKL
jgi:hypothetical protein